MCWNRPRLKSRKSQLLSPFRPFYSAYCFFCFERLVSCVPASLLTSKKLAIFLTKRIFEKFGGAAILSWN
jgi:hypothetical protein